MNKNFKILLFAIIISALFISACGGGTQPEKGETGKENVAPAPYGGKVNPFKGNSEAAAAGKVLYEANCLSCHGAKGEGDGPAGASLNPKPENFVDALKDDSVDFVFYRTSEGGMMAPYNSSMPAWKDSLSEDERWQIITYLETYK